MVIRIVVRWHEIGAVHGDGYASVDGQDRRNVTERDLQDNPRLSKKNAVGDSKGNAQKARRPSFEKIRTTVSDCRPLDAQAAALSLKHERATGSSADLQQLVRRSQTQSRPVRQRSVSVFFDGDEELIVSWALCGQKAATRGERRATAVLERERSCEERKKSKIQKKESNWMLFVLGLVHEVPLASSDVYGLRSAWMKTATMSSGIHSSPNWDTS
jgi:hypothetical protein